MKYDFRTRTLRRFAVALAASALVAGCQHSSQIQLKGGDVVELRSQNGAAEIFADDFKIIEIRTSSNARFISIHSEDGSLFSIGFKKGEAQPYRVDRIVEANGEMELVRYDEKGDVIERVPVE